MFKWIFTIIASFLLITACEKDTISDNQDTDLPGFWRYQSGVPYELLSEADGENPVAYLEFEGTPEVNGFTSRNAFGGTYFADRWGEIGIDIQFSTDAADTEWSGHFDAMVSRVDRYEISGNNLVLSDNDQSGEYTFIKLNDHVCVPAINDRDQFLNAVSDEFEIVDVQVFDTCLEALIQYSGGCSGIDVEMVGGGDYAESLPPQLAVRFIVDDNDPCEALVREHFYFDLTDLRYEGHDQLKLNIEGYDPEVLVSYP